MPRAVTLLLLAGCSEEEDPVEQPLPPGPTGDTSGVEVDPTAATLSELQEDLFTPTCAISNCHAAPGANGLVLEAGQSWANLVNVPAVGKPTLLRVEPGVSVTSYLAIKLEGNGDIEGLPMPLGTALDSTQINQVKSWINAGALDN